MRSPILAGLLLATFAALPAIAAPVVPAVTAARILAVAAADAEGLARGAGVRPTDGNAARLAALRSAMDGMALVEPDDVLALRAAMRHGAKPSPAVLDALRRLDAVEALAAARVVSAVSGPAPVRLDAEPDDLPPPTVQASR